MNSRKSYLRSMLILIGLFILLIKSTNGHEATCNDSKCKLVEIDTHGMPSQIKCVTDKLEKLCILCFPGREKTWYNMWLNPKVLINLSAPEQSLEVYTGNNWTSVVESSNNHGLLSWPSFSFIRQEYGFKPFEPACIGLKTSTNITADIVIKNPEPWFLFYLGIGLALFFFASSMSRNLFFHYFTGISFGVVCSILVVVFILHRFLPQKLKTVGYVVAAMSTSASLYLWRFFSVYINDILQNHWQIFVGYLAVAVIISFAVIYRYGPASDVKTLNLIQWTLQAIGLVFIYQGTQISEMCIAIIACTLTLYFLPVFRFFTWMGKIKRRHFPAKRRLLSEEEYIQEGEIETAKALEELRQYCRSPKCDAWKTLSQLHSPNRFAKFISGDSHLSATELEEHDTEDLDLLAMNHDDDVDMDVSDLELTR